MTCQPGQQVENKLDLHFSISWNTVLEGQRGNRMKGVKGSATAVGEQLVNSLLNEHLSRITKVFLPDHISQQKFFF